MYRSRLLSYRKRAAVETEKPIEWFGLNQCSRSVAMTNKISKSLTSSHKQRALRLACLIPVLLFLALVLTRSPQASHSRHTKASLKLTLFKPSYCHQQPPLWFRGVTSEHVKPLESSSPTGSVLNKGAEAAASAFISLRQAAQQDIQLAEAIWRSQATRKSDAKAQAAPAIVASYHARLNTSALLSSVEAYPQGSSAGRGIVMVSGGPKYTPPAYGNILFLRRSGCQLPVEVWVPPHEPIPKAVRAQFIALGNVTLHNLQDVYPAAAHDAMQSQRYLGKQLAILASRFKEILFLDADNLVLRDPTFLFSEALYTSTGLLMWPDFWSNEVKPGAWEALGIPAGQRFTGSHESGQVVLDKQRAWRPLVLAIFFNMRGDLFYPLLSDNGQGDKETLPIAWLALGQGDYGLVPHPVLALGKFMPDGLHAGRAMLQRSPDGIPLFLHVHFPKIDVPSGKLIMPPNETRTFLELHSPISVLPKGFDASKARTYEALNAVAGVDIEAGILELRQFLGCQPAWVNCCLQ